MDPRVDLIITQVEKVESKVDKLLEQRHWMDGHLDAHKKWVLAAVTVVGSIVSGIVTILIAVFKNTH